MYAAHFDQFNIVRLIQVPLGNYVDDNLVIFTNSSMMMGLAVIIIYLLLRGIS